MSRYDRYDDRYGNTRLYVGRLSSRTRSRDLEHLFNRYGRVRDVDMKREFAFIEFSDPRDADEARYRLDGREFDGSRLIVEFAKGGPRGSREYMGRGPTPGSGRCFNCGIDGHWARDCKAGDWKNKCYRCGERGHIERQCKNSPKELRRGRSHSRSRSPHRGRSRSPSYSRSYSPRSPVKRRRSEDRYDRSRSPLPSKGRERSPTPEEDSPHGGRSPSPVNGRSVSPKEGSDYSPKGKSRSPVSPMARSRSPISPARDSPVFDKHPSPTEANGRCPSPRDDSPAYGDDDDNRQSPRGSESP